MWGLDPSLISHPKSVRYDFNLTKLLLVERLVCLLIPYIWLVGTGPSFNPLTGSVRRRVSGLLVVRWKLLALWGHRWLSEAWRSSKLSGVNDRDWGAGEEEFVIEQCSTWESVWNKMGWVTVGPNEVHVLQMQEENRRDKWVFKDRL